MQTGDSELFRVFLENGADLEFIPIPSQPFRKMVDRLQYFLHNMDPKTREIFENIIKDFSPKKGGQFSRTRKNLRTHRTKKRKTRKL